MTAAKFVTNPSETHGLTDRITDPHFDALVKMQPVGMIPALVLLKPASYGGNVTTRGSQRHVKYEIAKCEPIIDDGDRENAMWQIQALYEARTSTGSQRPLPLGLPTEERRHALMEKIEDWSNDNDMTAGDLDAKWRETFGIGPDEDWSYGDSGVPGKYDKASVAHLLQFVGEHIDRPSKASDEDTLDEAADGEGFDTSDGDADADGEAGDEATAAE